ncbi:Fpg/Nei family DNA glycosylase [Protaetiibacter intestinalis]|uniref:DNA-(apurinic or apyrimidinic site) lyase n=1 Tax=Protaetiibacter intestinalis TaxID=2419774 RepID=A0A387B3N6_9MICO|nr:DNA-formamidopyrimidine glycosylase family protein [Protaetiibacter intestinalis]AYF97033.1 Fpg/Nei family DNA glycosylase [Protaetiibacter intestinalis]
MPEGHSVHRIARQFAANFEGAPVAVSSPQGRFAAGAAQLDGHEIVQAKAVGKQMFLEFDHGLWLRVHLGMYGAWDFAGDITVDDTLASAKGRMGQTNQRGTVVGAHEDSPWSIGAPRRTRLRMAESEKLEPELETWPPEPVGAVRVRLLTETACADLRGPTACEVQTIEEVDRTIAKLGPDPLVDDVEVGEERFTAVVRKKPTPIALLLMDQSVVSGIGNVYRAELLFRARLDPFRPGREVPEEVVRGLWRDWVHLLRIGVETGQMLTMDDLDPEAYARALASRDDRHWVYHRTGEPCRVCGTGIAMVELGGRKLYWCPTDQV